MEPIPVGLCQCGCGATTAKAPYSDRNKGWMIGEPLRFIRGHRSCRPIAERLAAKVRRGGPDDCWPWEGRTVGAGYGTIGIGRRGEGSMLAHRLAWVLERGPIPKGLNVLHSCDNPPCCNPAHLFLGTQGDNMRDMAAKGRDRHRHGRRRHGED